MNPHQIMVTTPERAILTLEGGLDTTGYTEDWDSQVRVWLRLSDVSYEGRGGDTREALIHLARQLPRGYGLRACLSCRHGHFCPVGNGDNEIFCVSDFSPQRKEDLYQVTEAPAQRAARRRRLLDCCQRYQPQSPDCYTYNDFWFEIQNP